MVFYLSLPIPRKKTGGSHPWWNRGETPPDAEESPGSRYRQRLGAQAKPRAYSRYIHVKQEEHERRLPFFLSFLFSYRPPPPHSDITP